MAAQRKTFSSATIFGATAIVKRALETGKIFVVRAPSGDAYTAGPNTPAIHNASKPYVVYGYGKSVWIKPEVSGGAYELASFLVDRCGRGNALQGARKVLTERQEHDALAELNQDRSRRVSRIVKGWK